MMEQGKIIPTGYKSKIPHTLSYPVGAKQVSEALIGVPQFSELAIEFGFWNQLARDHGTATPYRVIRIHYSGLSRFPASSPGRGSQEQGRPIWTIAVDAVPRAMRHAIQNSIVNEALPAMRSWLVANAHSGNRDGGHGITFSFDEGKEALVSKEHASMQWHTIRIK